MELFTIQLIENQSAIQFIYHPHTKPLRSFAFKPTKFCILWPTNLFKSCIFKVIFIRDNIFLRNIIVSHSHDVWFCNAFLLLRRIWHDLIPLSFSVVSTGTMDIINMLCNALLHIVRLEITNKRIQIELLYCYTNKALINQFTGWSIYLCYNRNTTGSHCCG